MVFVTNCDNFKKITAHYIFDYVIANQEYDKYSQIGEFKIIHAIFYFQNNPQYLLHKVPTVKFQMLLEVHRLRHIFFYFRFILPSRKEPD